MIRAIESEPESVGSSFRPPIAEILGTPDTTLAVRAGNPLPPRSQSRQRLSAAPASVGLACYAATSLEVALSGSASTVPEMMPPRSTSS